MSVDCLVCQTPTVDGYLCFGCWRLLEADLSDLAGYQVNDKGERLIPLAVELDVTLSRQERRAKVAVMVTGTPERPLPVNLHAGRVRDRLEGILTGWATRISLNISCDLIRPNLVQNAQFLLDHPAHIRMLDDVDELFTSITEAIAAARKVIDNRSVRIFVGECGAELEEGGVCTAALWADSQYAMTRCTFCDTSWPSMDRWEGYLAQVKADRLEEVRRKQLGPRRMARVLTALGVPIDESTIRKHAKLGKLEPAGLDLHGRKIYLGQDVINLVQSTADLISTA